MMRRDDVHRLDALLRVRTTQQDLAAAALAQARREAAAAERAREEMSAHQRRVLEEAGEEARSAFYALDVARYYAYERHLARETAQLAAEVDRRRDTVDQRLAELEDAAKRKRMIERLQARRLAAYQAEVVKAEQAMADEIAVNRAGRRSR